MKISVSILNSEDKKEMIKTLNNTNISYIHMDVMDGQFVPQRTLSYPELQELSGISTKKLDIHLMMDSPEEYIDNISLATEKNRVYRGTTIYDGEALILVTKIGMDTLYGKMAKVLTEEEDASPLKLRLTNWLK